MVRHSAIAFRSDDSSQQLPIDAEEMRLMESIDGRRTLREVADVAGSSHNGDQVVAFFRRLWWWDQIVLHVPAGGRAAAQPA